MVIFDTTVLIEISRGNLLIKNKIELLNPEVVFISSITVAEFIVGAKDKADLRKIQNQLENYSVLSLNEQINTIFLLLFNKYSLSHRPGIADILIAATALAYDLPILTNNVKHFHFIPSLKLIN